MKFVAPEPRARERTDSAIRIQPYTEAWCEAVADFNRRVRPAKPRFELPESPATEWIPKIGEAKVYQEMFLAVEGDSVRGAYTFKHQEFCIGGRLIAVGMCRMPISEGIVDKRYSLVALKLVEDATRRQPLLYGLGVGTLDAAVTKLVFAMGWRLRCVVPFFFKVRNGSRFLRNIRFVRTTGLRRLMCDAAAASGVGWAGAKIAGALLTRNGHHPVTAETVTEFSAWADEIWQACRSRYSMIGFRDTNVLKILYPQSDQRFIRLKVLVGGRTVGWAVLLDTAMCEDRYFGNMRVGSIVDCLAAPEHANQVVRAAASVLEKRGVDLLLSNQNHPAWRRALRSAGFVAGPSNFYFITSLELTKLLNEVDPTGGGIHLNRGDGEGPIHL
jgi:hypothetical protein